MKRFIASLCAGLIACPPSAWAGFKAQTAPVSGHGVSLPGLSLTNLPNVNVGPAVTLPEINLQLPEMTQAGAQVPSSQQQLPSAQIPTALIPMTAVVPTVPGAIPATLIERLAEPLGKWASENTGASGKQEAAQDFNRRAFGAPNDGSGTPVGPAGDGEKKSDQPLPKNLGPHVVVLVRVADAQGSREAALEKFSKDYGFKLDYGFSPVADGVTATFRGLVPMANLRAFAKDPEVLQIAMAVGGVSGVSLTPYAPPAQRENLFRATLRRLHERAEPLALLLSMPFALGTLLAFGPIFAAFSIPAAAAPVMWAVMAGGLATLISITPLQVFVQKLPPAVRFSIGPVMQAAGGVWLALHAAPLFGAWAVANAVLGGVAAVRVMRAMKDRRSGHRIEDTLTSTELSALIAGLSAGLTALALAVKGGSWALGLAAFATVTLASLALPGFKAKAPAATPQAAANEDPKLSAAREFGRAGQNYAVAEKRRGRTLYASAAAMVLAPLSLAGGMKLVALGLMGMLALKLLMYALVAVCVALMIKWVVELARVSQARARLQEAAAGVNRAAGAQTADDVRRALRDAKALSEALLAVEKLAPKLSELTSVLRRDAEKLSGEEARALEALEKLLQPGNEPKGDRALAALLAAQGRAAISARRRLMWDDETLTPQQAESEDSRLDALARAFAKDAGAPDDAEKELTLVADRLDKLYETTGALDARKLALAVSATRAFRWAEFQRGRTYAGKNVMILEAMLRRQGRNPDTDPEKRRAQARTVLEAIINSFSAP